MNDEKKSKAATFLSHPPDTPIQVSGFYDYGRGKASLRVDHVRYNLKIAPQRHPHRQQHRRSRISNARGKYGLSNLWCQWEYSGMLSEDGKRAWGRWGRSGELGSSEPRFWGMWLEEAERDVQGGRERVCFETMAWVAEEVAKAPPAYEA
ncbi:hypothetical protein Q7P37_010529 [Cladosporium fusiforme]